MSAKPQLAPQSTPEALSASNQPAAQASQESGTNSLSESIAQLAYTLWQQRGCPIGSPEVDWLTAEQQVSR